MKNAVVLGLMAACCFNLAHAQETRQTADNADLLALDLGSLMEQEVIVTSQRREEKLQQIPLAVSAFSSHMLKEQGIHDLSDIGSYVPNVDISGDADGAGGSINGQIYIRGIGQSDFLITTDPGVGLYLDGVYFGRSTGALMDVFDLERVEVLRGPQGTLFGKNAIGGALSLISRRPENKFGGELELTAGNLDRTALRGALNMPVSDQLSSRFALSYKHRDGYVERVLQGTDMGDENSTAARLSFLWKPAAALTAGLTVDGTRVRQNSAPTFVRAVQTSGNLLPLWQAVAVPVINCPTGMTGQNCRDFAARLGGSPYVVNTDDPEAQLRHRPERERPGPMGRRHDARLDGKQIAGIQVDQRLARI